MLSLPQTMLRVLQRFTLRHGRLAGALCLLLLVFTTTLQVAHAHPSNENHADCSLCATAHTAAQVVILPTGVVAPVTRPERPAARQTLHPAPQLTLAHPLWNRPPPAASLPIA